MRTSLRLARHWRRLVLENRVLRARLAEAEERGAAGSFANLPAYRDPVTGLPDRALFGARLEDALAEARRNRRRLALMFLDLDGFKAVNDGMGHTLGDQLLAAVGGRLSACLRRTDTLARYGGDEFALLLPDIGVARDAARVAEKILARLEAPFAIDGERLRIGASIGIALFPKDGDLGESLIHKADMAMYQVKDRGKNAYRFFSEEMGPTRGSVALRLDI